MNELFERLKRSTTGTDVQEALASLGNINDPNERTRAANETVTLIEKYANELLERGQYKNAAYQYYSGSQVIQKFLSDPNSEKQWLRSSADALAKASQEHVSWDDLLGGAACMAISSLLRIQTGDWNVNQHLDTFIKSHDFSADQAATGCLYIPYDLTGAVNPENPNPSSLQRASNYTESYLLNTKPAAMFYEGIKRAIEIARQKLMTIVKFPSIRAVFEFDHDIIFGEEFKLLVKIENVGEGVASGVSALITIPQMLNVISGSNSISIALLKPNSYTEAEFLLLYPSGEGKEEMIIEIPVNVEYQDILLNKNSLSLGTAQIPIRFEKKAQKLLDQLKSLEETISKIIAPLKSIIFTEIQPLVTSFNTLFENICTETKNNIEKGEFSSASIGIDQLKRMQSFIDPFVDFLLKYNEYSKNMLEEFQTVKENTESLVNSLERIKKQLSQ